ncbi:MAG: hypothetical protein HY021_11700, partial [Burkholderiales bacterium]|nr:hypothetical protein [Burkholderiales bacterium]
MSIRVRLILLVLSVMFPALAAALWVVSSTVAAEREALARNMRDMSYALSAVVDRELGQRDAIAHLLSQSQLLDDWPMLPAGNLRRFEDQARRAVEGLRGWVALRSADGELLNTLVPSHGPSVAASAALHAAPAAPLHAASAAPLHNAPTALSLARNPTSGELSAVVERPVQRNGRTLLNVSVTVLPAELQRILDQQSIPAGWVVDVLDAAGTLVARAPGGAAQAGRMASPDWRRVLGGQRQAMVDTVMPDGAPAVAYFSTSSFGWTCVSVVPRSQFAGRLPGAAQPVLISTLLLVALALVVALWVSRRISRPIDALRSAAADLQCGQPVQRRATGVDECDEVLAT